MLNKLKKILLCTIVFLITLFSFTDVYAKENINSRRIDSYIYTLVDDTTSNINAQNNNNCEYVFGDPNDDSTIAWMLQNFLIMLKL